MTTPSTAVDQAIFNSSKVTAPRRRMAHARKPKSSTRKEAKGTKQATTQGANVSSASSRSHQLKHAERTALKRQVFSSDTSPKKIKRSLSTIESDDNHDNVNGAISSSSSSVKFDTRTVALVDGERIQVQTAIEKLAKNMNRPSVFIKLGANDFAEQFAACFKEHIEGFVGLRGSKRERSEKELNMEWRQRVSDLKKKKEKVVEVKKNGQTVNERERLLAIQRYRELRASKKIPGTAD